MNDPVHIYHDAERRRSRGMLELATEMMASLDPQSMHHHYWRGVRDSNEAAQKLNRIYGPDTGTPPDTDAEN